MNDYEQLGDDLCDVINRLEGMSVNDADHDERIYQVTEELRSIRDEAYARA